MAAQYNLQQRAGTACKSRLVSLCGCCCRCWVFSRRQGTVLA